MVIHMTMEITRQTRKMLSLRLNFSSRCRKADRINSIKLIFNVYVIEDQIFKS